MSIDGDERRVVSIVFADLVGSTALAERLDPEEAKLVLGEAVSRLIAVVDKYGGHVKDIAGDGVLAFFGAPTAHEDDPERAVRAGLDITHSVADYADMVERGWGIPGLSVRVGVHTGSVVVGSVGGGSKVEYGAVGDVVNVAARLQAQADPGTVVASETTRGLAIDRFDWGPPTSLELKGKTEPVVAYRAAAVAVPSRQAEGAAAATPLVGREKEVSVLEDCATSLDSGRGLALGIVGEPGIGKSRMAAELRRMLVGHTGVTWLEGRAVSYGEALPYWPYRDLLRSWLEVHADDPELKTRITLKRRLAALFGDTADEVLPYLSTLLGLKLEGEAAARVAQISPEAMQYRTFEVWLDLVARICAAGPVALFVDDLHWADPTSLALTERLLGLVEGHPLLLVFSMRPETDHAAWTLKERAGREYRHVYRELDLGPLAASAEEELLHALVGPTEMSRSAIDRVLEFSGGNAFYLEEMVHSMQEQGDPRLSVEGPGTVPRTIESLLLARVDQLEPGTRNVLTAASVLGRSFGFGLLCAVAGADADTVRAALHHLFRQDLLRDDRRGGEAAYRFKHALIQQAAYGTLTGPRRAEMHARAARWFEDLYTEQGEPAYGLLAHHWQAAGDAERAAKYLRLAGDHALNTWALDEAAEHYRALLPLLEARDEEQEAAELLFQLGTTLHLAMRYREANEVWQQACDRWRYPAEPGEPATAGLVIASGQIPWETDPGLGYYATNQALNQLRWDALLQARPAPYVVPGLASRWAVDDDGLTYRFELREGLTWRDGSPMTAHDVVYAFRRVVDPQRLSLDATMLFVVENGEARSRGEVPAEALGVRALDDRVAEVRLNRRAPFFIFYPLYPEFSVMRADLAENGPFSLADMNEERVAVERDKGYSRRRGGNVARVEFVLMRDSDAVTSAAAADAIDAVWGNVEPSGSVEDVRLERVPTPPTLSIFATAIGDEEFATDVHLRRALALATDRAAIAGVLHRDRTPATGGLVPPGIPGHTADIALRFDPEEARRSLGRSAHRGPLVVVAAVEQYAPHVEALLASWREHLGLEVRLIQELLARSVEWQRRAHISQWHWVAHAPSPDYFLRNLLHSRSHTKVGGWRVPALEELLDRAVASTDTREQLDLYHRADRMAVQEECVVIPIAYGGIRWLVKPWVKGIWQWGAPWQSWDEVVIDERSPRFRG